MQVYQQNEFEAAEEEIQSLGAYHPRRGGSNPRFDDWSQKILDLKDGEESAIDFFFPRVERILSKGICVVVVPGHDPATSLESGLVKLAQKIASEGRVDGSLCLQRTKKTHKLAYGGPRGMDQHLETIAVNHLDLFKERPVILMDDVATTGSSCKACRQLLLEHGAPLVRCLVLGQTVTEV